MKVRRIVLSIGLAIIGGLLIFLGGYILTDESVKMLSGLAIGIGSASLSLGIGSFILTIIFSEAKYEEMKKQKSIEIKDERNTRIREKTGCMVANVINYMACFVVIVLGFMQVEKTIILIVSSLIVAHFILVIIFTNYYSKRI